MFDFLVLSQQQQKSAETKCNIVIPSAIAECNHESSRKRNVMRCYRNMYYTHSLGRRTSFGQCDMDLAMILWMKLFSLLHSTCFWGLPLLLSSQLLKFQLWRPTKCMLDSLFWFAFEHMVRLGYASRIAICLITERASVAVLKSNIYVRIGKCFGRFSVYWPLCYSMHTKVFAHGPTFSSQYVFTHIRTCRQRHAESTKQSWHARQKMQKLAIRRVSYNTEQFQVGDKAR